MILQLNIGIITLLMFLTGISNGQPSPPTDLTAIGYDSHIELTWAPNPELNLSKYNIYYSPDDGTTYQLLKAVNSINNSYIHFVSARGVEVHYKLTAQDNQLRESDFSQTVVASTFEMTDEELLTMVQEYTFRYFWIFAHPVSGLARERNSTSIVTTGGSGFGIMAILVGIERGFISREEGLQRLLKIVSFLEEADKFHGVFPHWMNGATGKTVPFSPQDDGGDLVETGFLMQGLLTARSYFNLESDLETRLRDRITQLWEAVEWDWHLRNDVLLWHWSPNHDFAINLPIRGYNEALIIYLLAVASPTHPIPPEVYHKGWAGGNYRNGNTFFGITLDIGPPTGGPLFFAHYSFLGFDPRNKKDAYTNYFIHNRNHTLLNRAYCVFNTGGYEGYSEECWGLTASDDPIWGYFAHEASPSRDNGTLTPTAAVSSMPYTPEESLQAMKHFYRNLGDRLWGEFGFFDAFNLTENWFADSYLAIDQGPIIGMIENYRTGLLWKNFMENPEIQPALESVGFQPDSTLVGSGDSRVLPAPVLSLYPNPADQELFLKTNLPWETLDVFNLKGELLWSIHEKKSGYVKINLVNLLNGIYILKASTSTGQFASQKFIVHH